MAGETNFQRVNKKMKLTLTALNVAATMFAAGVSAFDPDDLQKLMNNNACKSCDLSAANLAGADLALADLTGASLWLANLTDVSLYKADLTGADLGSAIVMDIILCNTTMPDGSVIYSGC